MTDAGGPRRRGRIRAAILATPAIGVVTVVGSCCGTQPQRGAPSSAVLRVGIGQTSNANPTQGLRQLSQNLAVEGLARTGEDGRMLPSLAEGWAVGGDGRTLTVKLRPNVKFHDGSPADAESIARMLPDAMRPYMGSAFSDVDNVRPVGRDTVEIAFHASSPFMTEVLESALQKPGGSGTGAFVAAGTGATAMEANHDYYLGAPVVQRVQVQTFPTIRAAWAEMLRGGIDMLYEVGPDALPSMQNSSSISVFTFTRRYQYVLVLNPETPALHAPEVRRALNIALDREEIVRSALNGYGVASSGPVWPRYWALSPDLPKFEFDPAMAARLLGRKLKLACLVPPDAPFERIALEVKRQLAAVGVELNPEEVSLNDLTQRAAKRQYEAMLIEVISGPTLLRPYLIWHSNNPLNWGQFGNSKVDAALDRVRHAAGEGPLRNTIKGLQQTFMDDPPAVFLAWSQRARAVSKRFIVPAPEPGREILSNLRLWKPSPDAQQASRN